MKIFLTILLLSFSAIAQPAPKDPTELPQNFMALGVGYNPTTSPAEAGWISFGYLVDKKSGTYMFTTEDITSTLKTPYTVQTSVRVGVGTIIKDLGRVKLFGILDGGGATSQIGSGGAASARTMLTVHLGKSASYLIGVYGVLKTTLASGTPKLYEFGYAFSW